LLIVSVATILLHNARFHTYLLTLAEKKASDSLGVPVEIQNFAVHLSNVSLDVYGVTLHGAEPYANPPLLQVRHIEVGVRVVSVLNRKWYLDNLRIDDPVARVYTDARGVSNIPKLKSSGGSHVDIFEIGIRHVLLDHGEAYYNNKKTPLEADMHDVDFRSAFHVMQREYSGTLSYRKGRLQIGSFRPILHDLSVRFAATPTMFRLTQAKIASGASQFTLAATLMDYSNPIIQGQYEAILEGGDLRRILRDPSLPTGLIRTSGSLRYRQIPNVPMVDSAMVNGDLSSARLDLQTSQANTQIRDIAAKYSLANGGLMVKDFRARLLGGTLAGTLTMRDITGKTQSKLNASLRGISLSQLKRMAPKPAATRNVALAGVLNADANVSWGKTLDNLVAHADATIRAGVSRAGNGGVAAIPVNGAIHGTYRAAAKDLALTQSYIRTPQTFLTMNGTVSNRSSLAVKFQSNDLSELETIADLVRTIKPGQPTQALGLAGMASFIGTLRGSTAAPHLTGRFVASNLQVKGTKWRVIEANVDASSSLVKLDNANLEPATHGEITLNGRVGLTHWAFRKNSPIQIELHAAQINVADLEKVTGLRAPFTGTMTASVSAHGTELNPTGHGSISLTHAELYGEPIRSANLTFTGGDGQIAGKLMVHSPAGTLQSVASVRPEEKTYRAQIEASGIHLDQLQPLQARNVNVKGVLTMTGSGQGTWTNPQFSAELKIPQLTVQQQSMQAIQLQLAVANHVATADLNSKAVNTSIRAQGKVYLAGDYPIQATVDTQNIPLQPLFAIYAPEEAAGVQGQTEVHATLNGPLKNRKMLEAHVTIPILKVSYGSAIQLAAAAPIHIDYKNEVLNLQRATIRGTDTDLQLQGSIPIAGHAPASLLLLGTVNLQLAQLFNPDIKSSGELRFNINSYGVRANPNVEGEVNIVDANFTNGDLPIGLLHGNGVLTLTKNRLYIKSFQATVGGGTVTARGGVVYRPAVQFDLAAAANGVRMLYPQGMREEVSANLNLTGTSDNALLGGRVRIEDLSFTPDFDLTNFAGQLSGGISPPPSQGFEQNLGLNLALVSTNNLNLVSRTLSVDGTANLQVRGTAAQPIILGRVNLSGGDLIFNGNRFTLNGGTVEFVNPAQTQPVVNVALNTTIQQYNIHLRFNGPVDQLRTNYSSDPSLPSADIINLLAFGQTTEASAANPTPGDQAAMSAVASQVSSQITSRVSKVAGISQLSINPVLAGGSTQGPAGAIVTIQQRVTGNLFVTFSTNVTSTQNQIIMGQYRLSPKVALSATRDQNGGFGFDTTFKKSW
jgi:translocation and assembly module TamB